MEDKELFRVTLDWSELKNWKDTASGREGFPILGFATLYRTNGIPESINKYYKDNNIDEDHKLIPAVNILCNPATIVALRRLIQENWESYDIVIEGDNQVKWKLNSKYGKNKHYRKRLTSIVKNAIDLDFCNYSPCPFALMPQDTLIFVEKGSEEEEKIVNA